jgi:hypothetical protein
MSSPISGNENSPHAITDLYDEQRNTFLIQYPPTLIVTLGLTGVAAFALTGLLGYYRATDWYEKAFFHPWPLFFWFCALMITLQMSIFRHPSLKFPRYQTLAATLISIVTVIIVYFYRADLADFLNWLSKNIPFIKGDIIPTLINYGLLAIFWFDTIRRWILRSQGKPIAPKVDLWLDGRRDKQPLMPGLSELISGDLIAGGALAAALMFTLNPDSLKWFSQTFNPGTPGAPSCAGPCHDIDRYQMLIYFAVGLLVLALTAVVNGLNALNEANNQQMKVSTEVVAGSSSPDTTGTDKGTSGVVQTLIETIQGALTRQVLSIVQNFFLALRSAAWPFLILGAVAGLGIVSRYLQYYLHGINCSSSTELYCRNTPDANDIVVQLQNGAWVIAAGLVALLGTIFAAALLIYKARVVENTLRFARLVVFIVVLTFWIFSLSLTAFNWILLAFDSESRRVFTIPGYITGSSFLILIVSALFFFLNRNRRGDRDPWFVPRMGERTRRNLQEATPTIPVPSPTPSTDA